MQYQLSISIDDAALKNIYAANQAVTLVKSVVSNPLGTGNLPVAWLEFQPAELNTITWIENYYLYASQTTLQAGATIALQSQTSVPVNLGWNYTFQNGFFTSTQGTGTTFNATNQQGSMFEFGLAQYATVNNVNTFAPLNATPVLNAEGVTFTPIETISIFLSSYVNNGVVISQVASSALVVSLTSQTPVANIGFNDASNSFYLVSETTQTSYDYVKALKARHLADAGLSAGA